MSYVEWFIEVLCPDYPLVASVLPLVKYVAVSYVGLERGFPSSLIAYVEFHVAYPIQSMYAMLQPLYPRLSLSPCCMVSANARDLVLGLFPSCKSVEYQCDEYGDFVSISEAILDLDVYYSRRRP